MTTPRYMLNAKFNDQAVSHGPLTTADAMTMAAEIHASGHTDIVLVDLEHELEVPIGEFLR